MAHRRQPYAVMRLGSLGRQDSPQSRLVPVPVLTVLLLHPLGLFLPVEGSRSRTDRFSHPSRKSFITTHRLYDKRVL